MKRLIAFLCLLLLLSSVAAADDVFSTREGIQFGMSQQEVITTLKNPKQLEKSQRETRGAFVFETLELEESSVNGLKAHMSYCFLQDHLVAIQVTYEEGKQEEVREILTGKYSQAVEVPVEKLGNGVFAVDDEGLLSEETEYWLSGTVLIIFEGDKMKVTLINLAADWLKTDSAETPDA